MKLGKLLEFFVEQYQNDEVDVRIFDHMDGIVMYSGKLEDCINDVAYASDREVDEFSFSKSCLVPQISIEIFW